MLDEHRSTTKINKMRYQYVSEVHLFLKNIGKIKNENQIT